MKPAAFDYERPASLDAATRLLAEPGVFSKVVAGSQSLGPDAQSAARTTGAPGRHHVDCGAAHRFGTARPPRHRRLRHACQPRGRPHPRRDARPARGRGRPHRLSRGAQPRNGRRQPRARRSRRRLDFGVSAARRRGGDARARRRALDRGGEADGIVVHHRAAARRARSAPSACRSSPRVPAGASANSIRRPASSPTPSAACCTIPTAAASAP